MNETKPGFSSMDLALVVMSVVWGLNFTAVKGALSDFNPLAFNAVRFATSSLFLLSALKIREGKIGIQRKDVPRFIVLALIGNTAYQLFFINGIALTTATNSSLILATTPIFIVLFGALLRTERITNRVVQGVILSFTGVLMIILGSGRIPTLNDQSIIGDLLIIGNPICWSIYTVLSKPMLEKYSPLKLVAVTMAIGTIPLFLVGIPSMGAQNWAAVSTSAWLGLAFSAFLAVGVAYVIWYTGVRHIGSARTALYENLVTVFAVASAWILLAESMTIIQIAGAALVFISLYLVTRKNRANHE